jgi:hypothetical protein
VGLSRYQVTDLEGRVEVENLSILADSGKYFYPVHLISLDLSNVEQLSFKPGGDMLDGFLYMNPLLSPAGGKHS